MDHGSQKVRTDARLHRLHFSIQDRAHLTLFVHF